MFMSYPTLVGSSMPHFLRSGGMEATQCTQSIQSHVSEQGQGVGLHKEAAAS